MLNNNVVFYGSLSKLYQLTKQGKIKTNLQGSHTRPCKFWTALKVLSGIRDTIIIAHGPRGCAFGVKKTYKLTNCRNSGTVYEPIISTNMQEKQIIYGGEKELKNAIIEVDKKYSPKLIIVATSCASGIIGDNVDTIVDSVKKQIKAQITTIHCEGFAGEYRTGFDLAFEKLVEFMEPPTDETKQKLSDAVNIIGGRMGPERTEIDTDVKELIRLIKKMGAKVNAVIAGYCSLEELKYAPSVAVNCTRCLDFGYTIGQKMLEKFNTPLNSTILPYGIRATEMWLKGAAKYLNMEDRAQEIMTEEYNSIKKDFEAAKSFLIGKTAVIEGHDAIRSLSIAHMLESDFGMRAIIYNFHPWSTKARRTSIDYMLETGMDPEILITKGTLAFGRYESMKQTEEELLEFLGGLSPKTTVYFGSSLSFPTIPLVDLNAILNRPRFGYRGALKVAKCITTAFKYSFRPRSWLFKEMIFPKNKVLSCAKSLTPKLACDMPDTTMYAQRGKKSCMMN